MPRRQTASSPRVGSSAFIARMVRAFEPTNAPRQRPLLRIEPRLERVDDLVHLVPRIGVDDPGFDEPDLHAERVQLDPQAVRDRLDGVLRRVDRPASSRRVRTGGVNPRHHPRRRRHGRKPRILRRRTSSRSRWAIRKP